MGTDPSTVVIFEYPIFRIYKDGHVDRLTGTEIVPPSTNPTTGVQSKDIFISPESCISARVFLPKLADPTRKLPLLIYIHGGAFVVETPYSPDYNNYAASVAAEANVVVLSIHYRRAPEHPLPTCFEDSWEAVQWAAAHSNLNGPEAWLNNHVDFNRVYVGGDSAGATMTQYVLRQAGVEGLNGVKIVGGILCHPFFGNDEPDKLLELKIIFPAYRGADDPLVNPGKDPKLGQLGCGKVLVFAAGKDLFRDRAWAYYEELKSSGWGGVVEIVEQEDQDHVYHLSDPTCDDAVDMMKKVVSFLNDV